MDESFNAAFGGIGMDARPVAEAVDAEIEEGHRGLCCGKEGCVVGIPYAGNVVNRCDGVADFVVVYPSDDRFNAEVEE